MEGHQVGSGPEKRAAQSAQPVLAAAAVVCSVVAEPVAPLVALTEGAPPTAESPSVVDAPVTMENNIGGELTPIGG